MDLEAQITLAYIVLSASSAIPEKDFKNRFEEEFKRGLAGRVGVYIPPANVFQQFYGADDYKQLHDADPAEPPVEAAPALTWEGIREVSKVHPDFSEAEALKQISNRYKRIPELFKIYNSRPFFRSDIFSTCDTTTQRWLERLACSSRSE
jgi:hypothetical protein